MKLDAALVGGVILMVAAVAAVVVWIKSIEPSDTELLQGLAGPQRVSAPPAVAPAAAAPVPVAAPVPPEPLPPGEMVVYFDFDSAELPAAESAKLARMLDGNFKRIEAVGHADRIGPAAYNVRLSQRRADAVRDYFVRNRIDAAVIETSAKGETEPASGDACVDMGPERRANPGLVDCLQSDRRVAVTGMRGL